MCRLSAATMATVVLSLLEYLDERGEARMPFHQSHDVTVLCAADEIALPVTWDRSITLDLGWSFPDGEMKLQRFAPGSVRLLCFECCERRMRRLERRCPMSSFFNTPRA